ncbi:hypothetical protein ACIG56_34585 [Nocardia fusca]|uniref:hypothetical protein n=1 Tax=Nocardia fusca TaxID=941183 RepID=UPI0037C9B1C2
METPLRIAVPGSLRPTAVDFCAAARPPGAPGNRSIAVAYRVDATARWVMGKAPAVSEISVDPEVDLVVGEVWAAAVDGGE